MTGHQQELFAQGQKAAAKERWGEAHAAFLAAWSLKRQYQIAGNLGAAEVQLGRHREAAEHLAYYLREAPATKVKERQNVQALLAGARKHVGALVLKVEQAGAEVLVDGRSVGYAPLADDVFVEPGPRTIEAKLAGHRAARQAIEAVKGGTQKVALELVPVAQSSGSANVDSAGSAHAASARGANDETGVGAGKPESGPRKALIIAGAATSGTLLSAGIVFALVANGHAADAEEQKARAIQDGVFDPCSMPARAAQCAEHTSTLASGETFTNLSIWSFVLGGLVGAGTVVYAVAAPRSKPDQSMQITPVVGSRGGGITIVGRW